ncbi:alpha/beta hydrolase [Roseimarinus sediminis]|uniref:alpha/beta hydrolase n=1 Tax=Roseimarinus sediminis TaxID=1610899 RepID=UPI003D22D933
MRKLLLLSIALLISSLCATAQFSRGTVKESLTIDSKILGKQVNYTIYLPFDYETSNRKYPVCYLLHGYTDNDMGWMQFGEAHLIADELIAQREIPPMIIAMPDGGVSFYINNFDNSVRYEDFFIQEFIPSIERTYRIRSERRFRAIAGLSMGGYGTLNYALKYPEMFSAAVAFSAAIFSEESMMNTDEQGWERINKQIFGPYREGRERLSEHYRNNNAFDITQAKGRDAYRGLRLMLDCGDDDFLTNDNARLHIHLNEMEIAHEFRMRDGAHNWTYWRTGLPDALQFIGAGFHQF